MAKPGHQERVGERNSEFAPVRRKRLHILYLINDLLHHTKHHSEEMTVHANVSESLRPFLLDLVRAAATHDASVYSKQNRRINVLLDIWGKSNYFQSSFIAALHEQTTKVGKADHAGSGELAVDTNGKNCNMEDLDRGNGDAPFLMPATHGDSSAPYYDLPAANMMAQIIPNLPDPIKPQFLKPLQFTPGPADPSLVIAMKDFLKDVDILYGDKDDTREAVLVDVDEFGRIISRDGTTGEVVEVESYYGWSKTFCEKMQRKKIGKQDDSWSRGRSESFDRIQSPRKRRRHMSSQSSRSRSHTRSRSTSRYDRRSSPSKLQKYPRMRSRSRSITTSRSPPFRRRDSRSHSRSKSYSPPRPLQTQQPFLQPVPPPQPHLQGQPPPPLPFPNPFPHGIPLGPDGLPLPPPPPPNYTGPWPPPPPPLGPNGAPFVPPGLFVPPPPPPHMHGQHQGYAQPGLHAMRNPGMQPTYGPGNNRGGSRNGQRGGQQYDGMGRGNWGGRG